MSSEQFDYLLEKYLAQDLSKEEREEFQALLKDNDEFCNEYVEALTQTALLRRKYNNASTNSANVGLVNSEPGFANQPMTARFDTKAQHSRWPRWPIAAAAALVLCAITLKLVWQPKGEEAALKPSTDSSDVVVQSGLELALDAEEFVGRKVLTHDRARARVRFKDSTTIDLKENTQIRIIAAGETTGKQVETFQGLVEVKAAHQPQDKPLKLNSAHGTITVLGTVFWMNVDKQGTSIDLLDGTVVLSRLQDNSTLQLKAGQRAVISPDSALTAVPLKLIDGKLLYREEFDAEMKNWQSSGGQLRASRKSKTEDQRVARMIPSNGSPQCRVILNFQNVFSRSPDFLAIDFLLSIGRGEGGSRAISFAPVSDTNGPSEDAFDPMSEKPRGHLFINDRWSSCRIEISQTKGIDGQPTLTYRTYIEGKLFEAKRMRGKASGFHITTSDGNSFSFADFSVFERGPYGSSLSKH